MKTAILLMAHGSRIPEANNAVREVAGMLKRMTNHKIVEVAFREQHQPDIQKGIDSCVLQGAERILLVPYFLSPGAHVLEDLPAELDEARRRYPDVVMELGKPLGVHRKLAEIVIERIDESFAEKEWR